MNILFISSLYYPDIQGGAEIILQSLAEGLISKGHRCSIICTSSHSGIERENLNGVAVYRIGIKNIYWHYKAEGKGLVSRMLWHSMDIFNPLMARDIINIINSIKPDIVNFHNLPGITSAAWLSAHRCGTPSVQTLHDLYGICPSSDMLKDGTPCATQCFKCKLFRLPHPLLSNKVSGVIGVSHYVLERHLQLGLFKEVVNTAVIHNCCTPPSQSNAITSSSERRPPVAGFLGTVSEAKGVDLLLSSANELLQAGQLEIHIAGHGDAEFTSQLQKRHNKNVLFLGFQPADIFFQKIDFLVVPSRWNDTLPTVILEAFARGIPVVGSRRGGIPELIADGKNGILFDPNEPRELQKILFQLSNNCELLQNLKQFTMNQRFTHTNKNQWLDLHLSFFEKAIASSKVKANSPIVS